ncbi:MAG: N-acetylneuraminate synthase [Prevotellaceae bacterium]|jgi:N,N'-diacetyllegionaminate synthase|nr:N-acetylneuraminate synthase [Prevotellaceae bacterium]
MNNKTIIIAEAGVNHNASVQLAKKMIDVAVAANVDYVKFQVGIPELIVSKFAQKANYQKQTTGGGSQIEMIKKITLSFDEHKELKSYCDSLNVKYLCTPFDLPSIDFLQSISIPFFKIPSGEITNYPYLKKIAQTHKPIILSTGMSDMNDIQNAINILTKNGIDKNEITILHCNTEYPTPFEDVNLRAMQTIAEKFKVKVGYSDHTLGIEVPIAAVALGATVIEKHFTLDRSMEGPDHKASLEPDELKAMVSAIRNVEKALGNKDKTVTESERKNMEIARKSIVAFSDIKKGDVFTEDNITVKRPGNGISPMQWDNVIGKMAVRDFSEDELIEI